MSASRRAKRHKRSERWTAKRKSALVMQLLRGEKTAEEVAHTHGLPVSEVELWRDQFMAAGEQQLHEPTRAELIQQEQENKRLRKQLADLSLDVELLQTAFKVLDLRAPSLPDRTSDE